jgi:hypothetical protein
MTLKLGKKWGFAKVSLFQKQTNTPDVWNDRVPIKAAMD